MRPSLISILLVVATLIALTTKEAHAYIDLGSGSYLIQMLLASVFMSLFTIKLLWRRITAKISQLVTKFRGVKVDAK